MNKKPKTAAAELDATGFEPLEIEKIVREELDRNNRYLDFAQKQIETDRSFYKHLYTYAVAFLVFMIAVAAFFSYNSVSQMRADMKASVDAELVALRAQATATSTSAKSTVERERANVRTEVQKRIDTEFHSENIAKLVAEAAKTFAERGMLQIFNTELTTRLAELNTEIEKRVLDETRKINLLVSIERLSGLARADARSSFDELLSFIKDANNGQDAINLARSNVQSIVAEKQRLLYGLIDRARGNARRTQAFNIEGVKDNLRKSNETRRAEVIANIPSKDGKTLPLLVDAIEHDESLNVLIIAISGFNCITNNQFASEDYNQLLEWWRQNKESFDSSDRSNQENNRQ